MVRIGWWKIHSVLWCCPQHHRVHVCPSGFHIDHMFSIASRTCTYLSNLGSLPSTVCKIVEAEKASANLHLVGHVRQWYSKTYPALEQPSFRQKTEKDCFWLTFSVCKKTKHDFTCMVDLCFVTKCWRKLVRSKFNTGKKLADSYINAKGKKCFKGNRHLKGSAAYPPAFGREVPTSFNPSFSMAVSVGHCS